MLKSEAFRNLSDAAIKMLLIFLSKRQVEGTKHKDRERWTIVNNGRIEFTYAEGACWGINPKVFRSRLVELHRRGFIRQNCPGGGNSRTPATYFLTSDWRKWKVPGKEKPCSA